MNEFEKSPTNSSRRLGSRDSSARRKPPVDWDRVNGDPLIPKRGFFGWVGAVIWWIFKWTAFLILLPLFCYLAAGGIGAWLPENPDFEPTPDGIEIFIYSGNAHSEFILPMKTPEKDWAQQFAIAPPSSVSHIAIGWGDHQLYTRTQQWSDLEFKTAASAMFIPTDSVLHIEFVAEPYSSNRSIATQISSEQYQLLCDYITDSMAKDQPIEGASFGEHDQFFSAKGEYHMFNTCNNWVGNGMKASGIKVGRFTPLPKTVFWHLNK